MPIRWNGGGLLVGGHDRTGPDHLVGYRAETQAPIGSPAREPPDAPAQQLTFRPAETLHGHGQLPGGGHRSPLRGSGSTAGRSRGNGRAGTSSRSAGSEAGASVRTRLMGPRSMGSPFVVMHAHGSRSKRAGGATVRRRRASGLRIGGRIKEPGLSPSSSCRPRNVRGRFHAQD